MRLLNAQTIRLEEFFEKDAPPYAILSHTWGEEEVTFQDIKGPQSHYAKLKGYNKIVQSCKQATLMGLHYVWVDTCCIDKSSSAELSESINSMFRWYGISAVCFAYLRDVLPGTDPRVPSSEFARSVWFTRGWTLQELLAPSRLLFFASDWTLIEARNELTEEISTITRINKSFLHAPTLRHRNHAASVEHTSSSRDLRCVVARAYHKSNCARLKTASIAERMSWAAARQTTREEDIAYCLLGIFDINMPLLYGEGMKAFTRLQEELVRRFDDQSIFAWDEDGMGTATAAADDLLRKAPLGILASSPAAFASCGNIVPCVGDGRDSAPSITSKGIHLKLPLSMDTIPLAMLRCCWRGDLERLVAVPVLFVEENVCLRVHAKVLALNHTFWARFQMRSVYLKIEPGHEERRIRSRGDAGRSIFFRTLPDGIAIDPSQRRIALATARTEKLLDGLALKRTIEVPLQTCSTSSSLMIRMEFVDGYSVSPFGFANWMPVHRSCHIIHSISRSTTDSRGLERSVGHKSNYAIHSNGHLFATLTHSTVLGEELYFVDIKKCSSRWTDLQGKLANIFEDTVPRSHLERLWTLRIAAKLFWGPILVISSIYVIGITSWLSGNYSKHGYATIGPFASMARGTISGPILLLFSLFDATIHLLAPTFFVLGSPNTTAPTIHKIGWAYFVNLLVLEISSLNIFGSLGSICGIVLSLISLLIQIRRKKDRSFQPWREHSQAEWIQSAYFSSLFFISYELYSTIVGV